MIIKKINTAILIKQKNKYISIDHLKIAIFILSVLATNCLHAAKIAKIQGQKVLINLEGDPAEKGDIFAVYDPVGKKKGLLRIKGVRNDKAIGFLGKGTAQVGWVTKVSKSSSGDSTSKQTSHKTEGMKSSASPTSQRAYWGLMGGASLDSMSVDIDNSVPADNVADKTVALSGTSFSVKGFFDYQLLDQIWFRGLSGIQGLSAASSSTESGCLSKPCSVDIYYLPFDFWGRYQFTTSYFRPWVGVGFSLLFPVTKDATAIQKSSITNTSLFSVGFGFDWFIAPNIFIPVQVDYSIFPKSETVEASSINMTAGLGLPF
ncbi:MAG: outer membrane beta-barrel protein [Bdellovibrionales bacterium]|nr:outer membrane beta-barrel protein [Bdellovibrionales bacterium]